jgi:mRNA interferase RelE/StbE
MKNIVKEIINQLRENSYAIPNVKPLEGSNHDDYRPYWIPPFIVLDIGPRGDIYK